MSIGAVRDLLDAESVGFLFARFLDQLGVTALDQVGNDALVKLLHSEAAAPFWVMRVFPGKLGSGDND